MAFKIKPFYKIDNTPRYEKKEEPGVLGRANKKWYNSNEYGHYRS